MHPKEFSNLSPAHASLLRPAVEFCQDMGVSTLLCCEQPDSTP